MELQENFREHVSSEDASKLPVARKGNVAIYQKDGTTEFISYVYYMPNMRNNILSLGQVLQKGHEIHMEGNFLWLRNVERRLTAQVQMTEQNVSIAFENSS